MTNCVQVKLADADLMLQRFELRPLTEDDAPAYFERRNYVLQIGEGHFFSDSYEREQSLKTEQQRRDWCTEKHDHCIMGAFANRELVGFVMITQYGPPEDSTVEWEAAWVYPRYRGTGLTKALYEDVEEWTINQGYRFVKSFIREDNTKWLAIRRKLGFVEIGTQYVPRWADNTGGNMIILRRDLYAPRPKPEQMQTLQYLDNTISFLENLRETPYGVTATRRGMHVAEYHR